MKIIPQKHQVKTTSEETQQKNKWILFAEKMHKESPLLGQSEEINKHVREFRNSFSFEREE